MPKPKFKTIQFTITSEEMKRIGINFPRHVQGLYAENYKVLMKVIK